MKQYNPENPSKFLKNANNLYGWAMSQILPTNCFRWLRNLKNEKVLKMLAYRAYYEQTPSSIAKLFSKQSTHYNPRYNLKFELIRSNSKVLHNSFVHHASIVWNCLPTLLKSAESQSSFKANIKKYPKTVDQIIFGTNSTATNYTDVFLYF